MAVVTSQPRYTPRNGYGWTRENQNGVMMSAIAPDRDEFGGGPRQVIMSGMTELEYVDSVRVDEQMKKDVKGTWDKQGPTRRRNV